MGEGGKAPGCHYKSGLWLRTNMGIINSAHPALTLGGNFPLDQGGINSFLRGNTSDSKLLSGGLCPTFLVEAPGDYLIFQPFFFL